MLPIEFVVIGTPISLQAKSTTKARWRAEVQNAARAAVPNGAALAAVNVVVTLVYYYENAPLDVDNMIKPIQDGLIGVVLVDDKYVSDVRASKRNLNSAFRVKGLSSELARGFTSNREFVHIRIEEAPDPQELI